MGKKGTLIDNEKRYASFYLSKDLVQQQQSLLGLVEC